MVGKPFSLVFIKDQIPNAMFKASSKAGETSFYLVTSLSKGITHQDYHGLGLLPLGHGENKSTDEKAS